VSETDLLSLVGHEVLSPLGSIIGLAETLAVGWELLSDNERRVFIERVLRQSRALALVADHLLRQRAADERRLVVQLELLPGSELLSDLANRVSDLVAGRPLGVDIPANLPRVRVDPSLVERVLANLVVNADRYSPEGLPVTISAKPSEGPSVLVTVADRGPGIPVEHRDRVFEKFTRLHRGGRGVGLGLYMSRAFVEAMGGDIWVEDSPGGGALLVCRLPAAS